MILPRGSALRHRVWVDTRSLSISLETMSFSFFHADSKTSNLSYSQWGGTKREKPPHSKAGRRGGGDRAGSGPPGQDAVSALWPWGPAGCAGQQCRPEAAPGGLSEGHTSRRQDVISQLTTYRGCYYRSSRTMMTFPSSLAERGPDPALRSLNTPPFPPQMLKPSLPRRKATRTRSRGWGGGRGGCRGRGWQTPRAAARLVRAGRGLRRRATGEGRTQQQVKAMRIQRWEPHPVSARSSRAP